MNNYQQEIKTAVDFFWETRKRQANKQLKKDAGTRGAVTGGKQLDGFVNLFEDIAIKSGIPKEYIYTKKNIIPGYFRPTKNWDFVIISPENELIACLEFKSQVGSFGNNFNNRTEEVIGSSTDLWTAFREGVFNTKAIKPWVGYFLMVERSEKSIKIVRALEPHYSVMKEFKNTSYLDRYGILCEKLIREKLYDNTALIWTSAEDKIEYGNVKEEISINTFIDSFSGFLMGKKSLFNK